VLGAEDGLAVGWVEGNVLGLEDGEGSGGEGGGEEG
jgi:hypothetical protein